MTKEQFDREMTYGVLASIARKMLMQGLLSERDYRKMDTIFKEKYQPIIGSL